MTPLRRIGLLAALVLVEIAVPVPASACGCVPIVVPSWQIESERLSLEREFAVFSGKVVTISPRGAVTLEVVQVWKGDIPQRIIFGGDGSSESAISVTFTTCDWIFEVGETYLVFGYGESIQSMRAEKCTRTAPLADAAQTLLLLEASGHSPRPPNP